MLYSIAHIFDDPNVNSSNVAQIDNNWRFWTLNSVSEDSLKNSVLNRRADNHTYIQLIELSSFIYEIISEITVVSERDESQ